MKKLLQEIGSPLTDPSIFGMFEKSYSGATEAVIQDDRDESQVSLTFGVVARDRVLSGWGGARGGHSYCAWACGSQEDAEKALEWVEGRSDMEDVEIVDLGDYAPPRGCSLFHLYVCDKGHPALQ